MADGGFDFGYDDPDLDYKIDHDDYDDDDDGEDNSFLAQRKRAIAEKQKTLNETAPFRPGFSSTPYHGGESVEMPSYDERTPLIERDSVEDIERRLQNLRNPTTGLLRTDVPAPPNPRDLIDEGVEIQKVRNFIKARYPNAKVDEMNLKFSTDPKKPFEIVVKGPRTGETKVLLNDGSGFQKKLLNATFIKKSLGESYEELSRKESQIIYGETQNLLKDKIGLKNAEAEKEKLNDAQRMRQETERIRSDFINLQEERIRRGDSSEREEALQKLKQAEKDLKLLEENEKKDKKKLKSRIKK